LAIVVFPPIGGAALVAVAGDHGEELVLGEEPALRSRVDDVALAVEGVEGGGAGAAQALRGGGGDGSGPGEGAAG
jgi:hypothetical protein